jgi:TM2 domain-containing membrane protein YozV
MTVEKGLRNRLFAWWYFAIAAGFLLLDIHRLLLGESMWPILLRLAIAVGFALLGWVTLSAKS